MNVSKRDLGDVIITSVLGTIFGALVGFGTLYSSRRVGSELKTIETRALHIDQRLLSIAREMERRCGIHIDCDLPFIKIIYSADQLIGLRIRLANGTEIKTKDTEAKGISFLTKTRFHLRELQDIYSKHSSEAEFIDFKLLTEKFSTIMSEHQTAITRSCVHFR